MKLRLMVALIALGLAMASCIETPSGSPRSVETPGEWRNFRGPGSLPVGHDPGLPESWSTTENVEWVVDMPGSGWSSPIATGGRVFLTAVVSDGEMKAPQVGTDYSNEYVAELMTEGLSEDEVERRATLRDNELPHEVELRYLLLCLDLEIGEELWRRQLFAGRPPVGRHRKNSYTSATPVTDGESVYVYVANLGLWAFDLEGNEGWHTELRPFKVYLDFGTGASPAIWGDRLFIVNDNQDEQFVASFDTASGREIWRVGRDVGHPGAPERRSGWSTPFVWQNERGTELVTVGPYTAVSYDLEGEELWRLGRHSYVPIPSPFAYDGLLYVSSGVHGDDNRPITAIRPGARGDITLEGHATSSDYVVWHDRVAGTYQPTPVAYEGSIWVIYDRGIVARYDAKSGARRFRARLPRGAFAFTASPWAYNGKIFCLSEEGETYVLEAADELNVLRVNSLGEMVLASPAIVGDRLLIRTQTRLYSIRGGKRPPGAGGATESSS